MFKQGQLVYKVRPYTETQYCAYGGGPEEVPIGTKGIVSGVYSNDRIDVHFENDVQWFVSSREIELFRRRCYA